MADVVPFRPPQYEFTRVHYTFILSAAKDRLAIDAANSLIADAYTVTSIQTETRCLPVVWIAFDRRLLGMIARDEACYYKTGHDTQGPYRVGQTLRMGCHIQWLERPEKTGEWRH